MTLDADADPAIVAPSGAKFKIKDTKLYVAVVSFSKEWHKTFRTIKNRIEKKYKMEQIQITNYYSTSK